MAYNTIVALGFVYAAIVLIAGQFSHSPYGKMAEKSSPGFNLDPRFGWWLMEFPATASFLFFYPQGKNAFEPLPLIFAILYLRHYSNRGWFFPLSIRTTPGQKGTFSLLVVGFGMFFTTLHGYLNALWFSQYGHFANSYVKDPRFIVGWLLYEISFWFTIHSEYIQRNLRDPNVANIKEEERYKIPYGGGFEYVTNPQYLGELLAWLGWAIMGWNPAGVIVFIVSAANLVPRAYQQHEWYLKKFEDYPKERSALIPFIEEDMFAAIKNTESFINHIHREYMADDIETLLGYMQQLASDSNNGLSLVSEKIASEWKDHVEPLLEDMRL